MYHFYLSANYYQLVLFVHVYDHSIFNLNWKFWVTRVFHKVVLVWCRKGLIGIGHLTAEMSEAAAAKLGVTVVIQMGYKQEFIIEYIGSRNLVRMVALRFKHGVVLLSSLLTGAF